MNDENDRDTMPPSAPMHDRPPSLPPMPSDDAPATMETLLAEVRYSRLVNAHVVHALHTLTDRVNLMMTDSNHLGGRVRKIERSLGAASLALEQPVPHEFTNGGGS